MLILIDVTFAAAVNYYCLASPVPFALPLLLALFSLYVCVLLCPPFAGAQSKPSKISAKVQENLWECWYFVSVRFLPIWPI